MKTKNKIDLMEDLDDLEKYQGKWVNTAMNPKNGKIGYGCQEHDTKQKAEKCYYDSQLEHHLYSGWVFRNTSWLNEDGIIYLGAIPFKD